jgi:hypothetical protein
MHEKKTLAYTVFQRDADELRVVFAPAGEEPRFARVGAIDISHEKVDDALAADVGEVLKILVEWFKQRGDDAALAELLVTIEQEREDLAALPVAKPQAGAPGASQEFQVHLEQDGRPSAGENGSAQAGDGGAQPYLVVHDAPPLDPAKRAPDDRPVLEFEFFDVADIGGYSDALRDIYNGTRGGMVVRGVYS